jgi:AcrR family transcriptional regulator
MTMPADDPATLDPAVRDPGSARDRILRESLALFSVRGFADVSMSEIATAVGITKAALYYHFTGKEELFATAFANEVAMVRDQIATIVTAGNTLDRTAYDLAMFFLERGDRDMRRLHQDFMAFVSEDMRAEFFRDVPPEDVLAETLNTFFRHMIENGAIRPDIDIVSLVPIIFGMTHAQIRLKQNPKAPHASRSNEAIAASIVDILLYGIVPR